MAESTLTIDYNTLRREVGRFLAWSPEPGQWDVDQVQACEDILAAGYRAFLYPSVPGSMRQHTWSFLKPKGRLITTTNIADYLLPEDVVSIEGALTYESDDDAWRVVVMTTAQNVRSMRMNTQDDHTGLPVTAAVEPQPPTQSGGTRLKLLLWPTPDDAYTLTYKFVAQPNNLSESNPRPYGTAQTANCLIAAVLSEAESRFNDNQHAKRMLFADELAKAISQDRVHTPDTLGYNGDLGDKDRWCYRRGGSVTYTPSS